MLNLVVRRLFKNFLQADVIGSTLDVRGLCGIATNYYID